MGIVLVVEDDEDLRLLFGQILQQASFQAIGAENGEVGLAMTRKLLFDLIVCDVDMPRMNGFEFLTAIRQELNMKDTPIIMLSGNSDHQYQELAFELGAVTYLVKPVLFDVLLSAVVEFIQ